MTTIKTPKKLIEVALPLDAINVASARENYIYKGNPSAIHKWWAQRPLAAARSVIFAQMVNDPGYQQGGGFRYGVNKEKAAIERERLFKIIEDLVQWENTNNEEVLERARAEIRRSWREVCELNKGHPQAAELFNPDKPPAFHDPFAGSGALPLEAQRLGLETYASDLNPVAVTINKAMIEIPPRFAGRAPVGPRIEGERQAKLHEDWSGAKGLAEDVRRYGAWMRAEAERRIGHLYPQVEITAEIVKERPDLKPFLGQQLTVIAWLWARTVKSPNPAFSHVDVPLASTFILSSKAGRESWVQPVVEGDRYRFTVKVGKPPEAAKNGTKAGSSGKPFLCMLSGTPIPFDYCREEAKAGRMGQRLMAIVAEGARGRVYLAPSAEHEAIAQSAQPEWKPETDLPARALGFRIQEYGMTKWADLFTPRQLVALTTFSDLVSKVTARVKADALAAGLPDDNCTIDQGGTGAAAYAETLSVYLAFAISKTSEYSSNLTVWYSGEDRPKGLFARQAIPMVWDFAEQNPLGDIGGTFIKSCGIVADKYGEADVLARAKGTSVGGLQEAGVVESGGGKLRLLRWAELPKDWSPETDTRTPVWEALHQLIRALNQDGESAAGALLARMPARAEPIRALAYRLYTLCERKGWAEEARAYNELVTAWSGIEQASADAGIVGSQAQLDI